jgi:hypothetical protein
VEVRVVRVGREGVGRKRTRRGAAAETVVFVGRQMAVASCVVCFCVVSSRSYLFALLLLCLGSRRRVAVGGVGDGETGSISL